MVGTGLVPRCRRKASDLHGFGVEPARSSLVSRGSSRNGHRKDAVAAAIQKTCPIGKRLALVIVDSAFSRGGRKGNTMKAYLVFTAREPKIVAMARDEASENRLVEDLAQAGIDSFVAHEIEVDGLREIYGLQFEVIEEEVRNGKGLRVLDSNGRHILAQVQLADIGPAVAHGF
jgi:hypothetical protein